MQLHYILPRLLWRETPSRGMVKWFLQDRRDVAHQGLIRSVHISSPKYSPAEKGCFSPGGATGQGMPLSPIRKACFRCGDTKVEIFHQTTHPPWYQSGGCLLLPCPCGHPFMLHLNPLDSCQLIQTPNIHPASEVSFSKKPVTAALGTRGKRDWWLSVSKSDSKLPHGCKPGALWCLNSAVLLALSWLAGNLGWRQGSRRAKVRESIALQPDFLFAPLWDLGCVEGPSTVG